MHGGAADRSGLIHVGDEVIEVNSTNVEGKTPADVLTILVSYKKEYFCFGLIRLNFFWHVFKSDNVIQQNSDGVITFKLVPTDGKLGQRESKVRVKAYFDYNPDNDPYIPCKEAGLAFNRGDILHIVSQVRL